MLFFTIRKNLREPQAGRKTRRVRDDMITLIIKQKFAIYLAKVKGFQSGAGWFAQTQEISLFASPVGQVEYLPAFGSGAD